MRTFFAAIAHAFSRAALPAGYFGYAPTRWPGLGPKQRRVNKTNERLAHQGPRECARRRKRMGAKW